MPVREHEDDGGIGLDAGRDTGRLRRYTHEAMATVFEVYASHPDAAYAAQAAHAAFDVTDGLERDLSRFIANSDIARVNGLAPGAVTRVSATTMECLLIARHLYDLTGGAFDAALGSGLPSLGLDHAACTVQATAPGVRLDLGGIGKGYAVDLMTEVLQEWGLERILVHGGFSSVMALDAPGEAAGWALTLSDPASPSRVLARLSVTHTALGASGLRKGDHIVDPRTGSPVRGRRAAWVALARPAAPTSAGPETGAPRLAAAAVADALATAFMLMPVSDIERLCIREVGVRGWVLADEADGDLGVFGSET